MPGVAPGVSLQLQAYVDSSVILGQTKGFNEELRQYSAGPRPFSFGAAVQLLFSAVYCARLLRLCRAAPVPCGACRNPFFCVPPCDPVTLRPCPWIFRPAENIVYMPCNPKNNFFPNLEVGCCATEGSLCAGQSLHGKGEGRRDGGDTCRGAFEETLLGRSSGCCIDPLVVLCFSAHPFLQEAAAADIIFFCSPNNPTGNAATREQLTELVAFAKRTGAIIIYDAAYAIYIDRPECPKTIYDIPGARDVAIETCSFSKYAGFTGVRLGWTVVPDTLKYADGTPVIGDWNRIMTTCFNGASNVAQAGGYACCTPEGLKAMKDLTSFYKENARIISDALKSIGLTCFGGTDAPYVWVEVCGRARVFVVAIMFRGSRPGLITALLAAPSVTCRHNHQANPPSSPPSLHPSSRAGRPGTCSPRSSRGRTSSPPRGADSGPPGRVSCASRPSGTGRTCLRRWRGSRSCSRSRAEMMRTNWLSRVGVWRRRCRRVRLKHRRAACNGMVVMVQQCFAGAQGGGGGLRVQQARPTAAGWGQRRGCSRWRQHNTDKLLIK